MKILCQTNRKSANKETRRKEKEGKETKRKGKEKKHIDRRGWCEVHWKLTEIYRHL